MNKTLNIYNPLLNQDQLRFLSGQGQAHIYMF